MFRWRGRSEEGSDGASTTPRGPVSSDSDKMKPLQFWNGLLSSHSQRHSRPQSPSTAQLAEVCSIGGRLYSCTSQTHVKTIEVAAHHIYDTFLAPDAVTGVNIRGVVRAAIKAAVANGEVGVTKSTGGIGN